MSFEVVPELSPFVLKHFRMETLVVESSALKSNPWRDSHVRRNPVLIPRDEKTQPWPVVFVLAGFTGNGPNYFSVKSFEPNLPQVLDACVESEKAAKAIYVFPDATTFWGGSQFINSPGTGAYEDYLMQDLVPAVRLNYTPKEGSSFWCVTGGSSGGYGALHLASRYPEVFGLVAAIAPDCFFEASLLPEIYKALPLIEKLGGVSGVQRAMVENEYYLHRESHTVLNVIAMAFCYGAHPTRKGEVEFPIDTETGELKSEIWQKWKSHDPICFLPERVKDLGGLKRILLDVGTRDQFHLQYGARQIKRFFMEAKIPHDYTEYEGNHFDISSRRPEVWRWLKRIWG